MEEKRSETNLDSRNSDSDMSSLNHGHVVGSISDGEEDRRSVVLDELDDESLLERRDSAWENEDASSESSNGRERS